MKALEDNLVFVVDDNEMQSMMMDYVLSKECSYKVERFKSGEECLANLNKNPDAIVLDYRLPGMNGMETFMAIKKLAPIVPVFIITSTHDKKLEEEFLQAGAYAYIVKESNAFHNLEVTIESLLSGSVSIPEHQNNRRRKLKMIISGGLIIIAVIGIIYFSLIKHLH